VSSEILTKTEGAAALGALTRAEILQQPELWPDTFARVTGSLARCDFASPDGDCVFTGAGSSAYAGMAIQAVFPAGRAIPTTDLLVDPQPYFAANGVLVSLARSGDSPESVAVVRRIQRLCPQVRHLAITCNAQGQLAQFSGVAPIILDPRTNDRSLAMTSSFSNLALAGMCLARHREIGSALGEICTRVKQNFAALEEKARKLAAAPLSRVVVLASAPMMGWAQEASLKILEMSAGRFPVMAETHLGLRHGPMSFLRPDAVVLSILSTDPLRRRYEQDLLEELRAKKLGQLIVVTAADAPPPAFGEVVPAMAPELPDNLRTPFEIVFPQLFAYHLSLQSGLNPDNPSPGGVINRVVQGVRIHEG
jgi:tagatose-6-phosphate ketose/aldose isomerase